MVPRARQGPQDPAVVRGFVTDSAVHLKEADQGQSEGTQLGAESGRWEAEKIKPKCSKLGGPPL